MTKVFGILSMLIVSLNCFTAESTTVKWDQKDLWSPIVKDIKDQKYTEALVQLGEVKKETKEGHTSDFKRALILESQILNGLGRFDETYQSLKEFVLNQDYNPVVRLYFIDTVKSIIASKQKRKESYTSLEVEPLTNEIFKQLNFLYSNFLALYKKEDELFFNDFSIDNESGFKHESLFEYISMEYIQMLSYNQLWSDEELLTIEMYDYKYLNSIKDSQKLLKKIDSLHPVLRSYLLYRGIEKYYWEQDNLDQHLEAFLETADFLRKISAKKDLKDLEYNIEIFLRDRYMSSFWTLGMFIRAKILQDIDSSESLKILNQCIKKFQESLGHKNCMTLLNKFQKIKINLKGKKYYPIGDQSFQISSNTPVNGEYRVYRVHGLPDTFYQNKNQDQILFDIVKKSKVVMKKSVNIKKKQSHIKLNIKERGVYLISFYSSKGNTKVLGEENLVFEVTNLAYMLKRSVGGFYIYLHDMLSGELLNNAKVKVFTNGIEKDYFTDSFGMAFIDDEVFDRIIIDYKGDILHSFGLYHARRFHRNQKRFIRSFFSPLGQNKVKMDLLLLDSAGTMINVLDNKDFELRIEATERKQSNIIKAKTDSFGLYSHVFELEMNSLYNFYAKFGEKEYLLKPNVFIEQTDLKFEIDEVNSDYIKGRWPHSTNCYIKATRILKSTDKIPLEKLIFIKKIEVQQNGEFKFEIPHENSAMKIELLGFDKEILVANKSLFIPSKANFVKARIKALDDFIFRNGLFTVDHNMAKKEFLENAKIKIYSLSKTENEHSDKSLVYVSKEENLNFWKKTNLVGEVTFNSKNKNWNDFNIIGLNVGHYRLVLDYKGRVLDTKNTTVLKKEVSLGLPVFIKSNKKNKVFIDRDKGLGPLLFQVWKKNTLLSSNVQKKLPILKKVKNKGELYSIISSRSGKTFFSLEKKNKDNFFKNIFLNNENEGVLSFSFTKSKKIRKAILSFRPFQFNQFLSIKDENIEVQKQIFTPFIHMPMKGHIVHKLEKQISLPFKWFNHSHLGGLSMGADEQVLKFSQRQQPKSLKDISLNEIGGFEIYNIDSSNTLEIDLNKYDFNEYGELRLILIDEGGSIDEFHKVIKIDKK